MRIFKFIWIILATPYLIFTFCLIAHMPLVYAGNNKVVGNSLVPSLLPAFPGAEGFGAFATGGRSGRVIEVTHLEDQGPGSLREALMTTEPRIVVFRLGGEIVLDSPIILREEHSHLTIAGQTAPGGGITLRNRFGPGLGQRAPLILSGNAQVENVIIRFIRFRPGPSYDPSSTVRGLSIFGRNLIIDHCSFSWSTDEIINAWYNAKDITMQWNIISEGLAKSNHLDTLRGGKGHSRGVLFGDKSMNISFHHNLIAHVETRGPRVSNGRVDIVNNLTYNMGSGTSHLDNQQYTTPAEFNVIGNFIKAGPDSTWNVELKLRDFSNHGEPLVSAYLRGNIGKNRTVNSEPEDLIVDDRSTKFLITERHGFPPVTTTSAFEAYLQIWAGAGVTVPRRDVVDQRIMQEVVTGMGRIIDHPDEVGGWPKLEPGTPPVDRDHDGMPDVWEVRSGLDPLNPTDSSGDLDGDGYTNVEEYLNELAENPVR